VAQLDDVYSDLRLNYETLKGLISLASLSVAKPTVYEPVGLECDNELMVGRVCTKGSGDR
jgi:hypothetical protein